MTLPTRTVTATYTDPTTGYPQTGKVTFTPSTTLQATSSDVIVPAEPVIAYVEAGTFSVALVPTDVAEIQPAGWTYTVTETIGSAPSRSYSIQVPSGATALNLATIAPVIAQPALYTYVLASTVGQHGGPAGPLDSSGLIPAAQIPGGAGNAVQLGGDIGGTVTVPQIVSTHLAAPLPIAQGGTAAATASAALASLGAPPSTRQILAGTGLSGGGDLTADRTLTVAYGTAAGTAAQGNDARITGALQAANNLGDVGSVVTSRTSLQVTDPIFPISGYGLIAASGDPIDFQNPGNVSGVLWPTRIWVPAGKAITNLWCAVHIAGTWDGTSTPNQIGVYDDNGNQLGATVNDSTLWTAIGWRGGAISGGPIAAQTTGRFVYLMPCVRGISGMYWQFPSGANDNNAASVGIGPTGGNRRGMYATSTSSGLPATFNPTSYGTNTGYVPLVGIS
jgi:hypothetical protein